MAFNPRIVSAVVGGLAAGLALAVPTIQQLEGLELKPYEDVAGILSVCYGHTGRDVVQKKYTNQECTDLLNKDAGKAGESVLKVTPNLINKPYVLGAAISFTYNVGASTYQKSSVARDFNNGKFKEGCTDMLKYTYAGGKQSKGLVNRRKKEYTLCMKGA